MVEPLSGGPRDAAHDVAPNAADEVGLNAALEAALVAICGRARVRTNVALAEWTTFRVGGNAEFLVDVISEDELQAVFRAAAGAASAEGSFAPVTLLGGGSNVLISDHGISGVVIRTRLMDIAQSQRDVVRAGAGVTINGLVRWTIGRGLASLEAWAGTPGTVGGAIYGNAHYGGRNISDIVMSVRVADHTGVVTDVDATNMEFAYDTSRLHRTREAVIAADFRVSVGDVDTLRATARASLAHRKRTQPLDVPSAGCVFQNPNATRDVLPSGIPASAGALVDRAGLKGYRIGGARISPTHGNFIVNDGHATAGDIAALIEKARAEVQSQFGVTLRDEVVRMGRFD